MLTTGSPAARYSRFSRAMFSNWALRSGWRGPVVFVLEGLPPAIPMLAEQLRDDVATDGCPRFGDPRGDLPPRQVGPSHVGPHRVAGGVVLEHLEEVGLDRRVGRDQRLASAPFLRVRPVSSSAPPSSSESPNRMVFGSHPSTVAMYSIPP